MAAPSFHILGAGSIGLLYAYHLRQAAAPVTLLLRDWRAVSRFQDGGSLITLERNFRGWHETLTATATAEPVHSGPEPSPKQQEPIQNLLVATKSVDAVRAVRSVKNRLAPDASLILLQNGILAVYKELWQHVFSGMDKPPKVILASTTHGCYVARPFNVFHAGVGACTFAEVNPKLDDLNHLGHQGLWEHPPSPLLEFLLQLSDLTARFPASHEDLLKQLHIKLAVNCSINPITALLGCQNGQLAQDSHAKHTMRAVVSEVHALFGPQMGMTDEELYYSVLDVAQATAWNKSSMFQDILNGRITEIEHLNGYVQQQGQQKQVATPVNSALYHLVKARERVAAEKTASARVSWTDA